MKVLFPSTAGWAAFLVGVVITFTRISAFAHDPGLSSANLEFADRDLRLQLTFNERDLAGLLGISAAELRAGSDDISAKLNNTARRAALIQVDGTAQTPASIENSIDENNNVEFRYIFLLPADARQIEFQSILLPDLSFGHRQAFAAVDNHGTEVTRRILSARDGLTSIPLAERSAEISRNSESRFLQFLLLGIRHILTGYDHLLFLFGLLIVCRGPRPALLLITCFTLAHSLTLALSTFGLVNLPSRFVEATIAASILYVGLENLIRRDTVLRGRWLLTFVFGLVHGLGFASVLHEMGIARTGLGAVVPLVAFNIGVETGQLAVAAIVLPVIWQLRRRPSFVGIGIPACSLLVGMAGAYWLLERTILA
ncbi:MAG: HupE/UreJ family protein [Verrucomicrobiota bacterium]|nr:HupE/UreJ family protein [Verrucomicrobiota bacterium]